MTGKLGEAARRRPLLSFYLLAFAFPVVLFTYLIVVEMTVHDPAWPGGSQLAHFYAEQKAVQAAFPILTHHRDSAIVSLMSYWRVPLAAPFLFFPFAPTVAALIIVALARGRAGLRALLGAYRPVRGDIGWRQGLRLYLILAASLISASAVSALALGLSGNAAGTETFLQTLGTFDARYLAATAVTALFFNQGGLLEELGWRGYALPILMRRMGSPLAAALFLGLIWALWHFPREAPALLQGQESPTDLLAGQAVFITSCAAATVVFTTFVNLSGGSVLPSIMLHGFLNLMFSAFETGSSQIRGNLINPSLGIWVAGAALCLIAVGPDLGLAARRRAHGGDGSTDPARVWADPA